jgi:hypothetical protein
MIKKIKTFFAGFFLLGLALTACSPVSPMEETTATIKDPRTSIAQTVDAELTRMSQLASPTLVPPSSTPGDIYADTGADGHPLADSNHDTLPNAYPDPL